MCRLFAQRTNLPRGHTIPLCVDRNALRMQSYRHQHGWGIGWYDAKGAQVRRGILPAHADDAFVRAAGEACSSLVVGHVRDASVGAVIEENTHPFLHGAWLFAHNGTVARFREFSRVRAAIEREIDPDFRSAIAGETDSERCFYLFLTRLSSRIAKDQRPSLEDIRYALGETVSTVVALADLAPAKPSSLNLLVTNGEVLAACRLGRLLFTRTDGRGFAVSSEPVGGGLWREVPEDGFVGIGAELEPVEGPLWLNGRGKAA
ncbi:MAG TPA: class II glutamine amidotransferase [Anaeromyxobacteraceae bacterium]|nr:class II glutamine amidotransferase [Anaeromyxobacteraceae bacterium]